MARQFFKRIARRIKRVLSVTFIIFISLILLLFAISVIEKFAENIKHGWGIVTQIYQSFHNIDLIK